jgi:hypothetical protein
LPKKLKEDFEVLGKSLKNIQAQSVCQYLVISRRKATAVGQTQCSEHISENVHELPHKNKRSDRIDDLNFEKIKPPFVTGILKPSKRIVFYWDFTT